MKKNSKTDRRRLLNLSMRVVLALVMVGLLVIPVAVQADLKITAVVYAWDLVAASFQNGNIITTWDGTWVPFLHELNFDKDPFVDPLSCGTGTSSTLAGNMYYGLYHVDNAPVGAPGFQETHTWSLISCDRDGDGDFDGNDLSLPLTGTGDLPPAPVYERGEVFAECTDTGDTCRTLAQDEVVDCTTGNCQSEIVTTIQVNLDSDCDGEVDPGFPVDAKGDPDMVCFYAEARTPTLTEQDGNVWSNPLQARISTGLTESAGDKTVTFAFDPTAVDLAAFEATPQSNGVLLTWETANEMDNLGFNIYRAESQAGQLIKINQHLVASQDPGSLVGAAYSFLDQSAAPGATYYYWLEDIDASGTATKHGPATARRAAAKALPGRPRPAPMPGNAF